MPSNATLKPRREADFSVNWKAAPNWQRISAIIEEEIVSGVYVSGQQIKQGRICERFDVSVADRP